MRFNVFRVRNPRRLWDQFCEYTELPGFRFMTSKVTLFVRLAAIATFVFSMLGMSAQLWYLIGQYLRSQVQTSSRKYRIQQMALPMVYLCHPLNGTHPLPLLDLCRDSVFEHRSPDLSGIEQMEHVVPYCSYQIKLVDYQCELRCKWSSQGFCIEARLNATSGTTTVASSSNSTNNTLNSTTLITTKVRVEEEEEDRSNFKEVSDYDIKIYFNSTLSPDASMDTLALAHVFLRFAGDAIKWPTQIPLVGAPHMVMERNALNTVQVVEILKITRNDMPATLLAPVTYEHCIWRANSELASNNGGQSCPSEFMTNMFAQNLSDFTNISYGVSECALQRAMTAERGCREDREFNRFTVESAIFTRSAAEKDGLDPRTSPNLRIYPRDVVMQETLHQLRSAEWKLLSEIGGTLALYLGFTLMSLLEALVFLSVNHVRKVALHLDEESQVARKNPPIRKDPVGWSRVRKAVLARKRIWPTTRRRSGNVLASAVLDIGPTVFSLSANGEGNKKEEGRQKEEETKKI